MLNTVAAMAVAFVNIKESGEPSYGVRTNSNSFENVASRYLFLMADT